jgi:HEAT repeat protein
MARTPNLLPLLRDPKNRPDRRSIGNSNAAAALVLKHPAAAGQLVRALWDADYVVRMRAADALEKASLQEPKLLSRFKSELLGLLSEATQQELRWHLALMVSRLPLTATERHRAAADLRRYLDDRSSIVKTCALQAIFELSQQDSSLRAEALDLLRIAARTGTAAMRARSRNLLKRCKAEL